MNIRETAGSLRRLNRRIPLGVLALWALLYLPRPFRLGFYADDWWSLVESSLGTAPFSMERLRLFLFSSGFVGRPMDAVAVFLATSLGGGSPFVYQSMAAVLVLLAALSLRAWFVSLLPERDFPGGRVASDLAAMFWLSLPWSVASTAWPLLAPVAMTCQILFTESCRLTAPSRAPGRKAYMLAGGMLAASFLMYEPFYFQFFVVGGWYLLWKPETAGRKFAIAGIAATAVGSQLFAIGYNRLDSMRHGGKAVAANWLPLYWVNLKGLPGQFRWSLGTLGGWYVALLGIGCAASLYLAGRLLGSGQPRGTAKRILGLFLTGGAAFLPAVLVFSAAGYGMAAGGITARTLQGVSWALTVVFLAVASLAWAPGGKAAKFLLLGALLGMVGLNCVAQERVVKIWAVVWEEEKELLSRAPIGRIQSLPAGSRVLYLGPAYYAGMVIFGADWDTSAAVYSLPALSRGRRHHQGIVPIHSAGEYNWRWDGATLVQEEPGAWRQQYPASRLFLWNFAQDEVVEVSPGYRLDYAQSKATVQFSAK